MKGRNLLLLGLAVLITVIPLAMPAGDGREFSGADDQAEAKIIEIHPQYRPWFRPLWEPPGAAVESLLFALQAAVGGGLIGYSFGLARGRAHGQETDRRHVPR